jgi:hypothetical protein
MSPFHSVNQTNARSGKQPPGKRIKHNVAFTLSARRAIAQHRYSELSSSAPLGLSFDAMTVSAEAFRFTIGVLSRSPDHEAHGDHTN